VTFYVRTSTEQAARFRIYFCGTGQEQMLLSVVLSTPLEFFEAQWLYTARMYGARGRTIPKCQDLSSTIW